MNPTPTRQPCVLVVEDNLPVRMMLQRALERIGCRVVSENNGKDGIRRARKVAPDLILMDMRLPGLDGPEVLDKLRRTRGLEAIPVVGISGYAHPEMKAQAFDRGCVAFLEKPLDLAQLHQTVIEILGFDPTPVSPAGNG